MHIGFDVSQTGTGKAGCGALADAIISALMTIAPQHQYSLFPSFGDYYFDWKMPFFNPYSTGRYGPRHFSRESARQFWSRDDVEIALGNPGIIHANNFWCPMQLQSSRLIYTVHDMGFLVEPGFCTEKNRRGCFEGCFRSSLVADWIVAVSEASRGHYLEIFPHVPEERVKVVPGCSRFTNETALGKRPKALRPEVVSGEYWLHVGTLEPRKNQYCLVEAYADYIALGGLPMPLVLAGGHGWLLDDVKTHIEKLGISSLVWMLGYVSDEELIWLYRHCYAHLYPSLFEGFGLPILEGMQFGAPTITSNLSAMPEVASGAALLISPHEKRTLTEAMLALRADPVMRETLSKAGFIRAQQFDRKKSAAALLTLYEEAMELPKRAQ